MKGKRQAPSAAGRIVKGLFLAVCIVALLIGTVYIVDHLRRTPEPELPEAPVPQEPLPPAVPESTLDTAQFQNQGGRITYPDARFGIDVSAHQGEIDWSAVAGDGVEFAILRAGYRGYTEGDITPDERFAENLSGAQAAGIETGVYFFSQAVTEEEAVEEANFVLDCLNGASLAYPVYFDWEEILNENARTADMDATKLTACALAFCRTIAEAGYPAGIYFNQDYGYRQYDLAALKEYAFWLAEYAGAPSFRYAVGMWQYSDSGTVAGISENVDLNLYF